MDKRVYVSVIADYSAGGDITPVSIEFPDGRKVKIASVISALPMSSTRQGGTELRYSVIIRGQHGYLFLEHSKKPRWYISSDANGS